MVGPVALAACMVACGVAWPSGMPDGRFVSMSACSHVRRHAGKACRIGYRKYMHAWYVAWDTENMCTHGMPHRIPKIHACMVCRVVRLFYFSQTRGGCASLTHLHGMPVSTCMAASSAACPTAWSSTCMVAWPDGMFNGTVDDMAGCSMACLMACLTACMILWLNLPPT